MLEEAVERGVRVLGPGSTTSLSNRRNLALAYKLAGRPDDAWRVITSAY